MRYLFCCALFFILPFTNAQSSYIEDLEEFGYCVIPEVFSAEETTILYERVWHEFIEKAWPNCRMDERSNWKDTFPIQNLLGIFAGPAGQIQVMWDLRQDPRIVDVFANIWNTQDLIVSMDGISIMCPGGIRETVYAPWPHVDQGFSQGAKNAPPIDFVSESSLKTHPFTIQGQFLFEDSFEGDGGFYCIPKSHLTFEEFAPIFEAMAQLPSGRKEARDDYVKRVFGDSAKHITASKGSLILWDSRTIHWNQHPLKSESHSKVRMVGYMCYVPKSRLNNENRILRNKAFDQRVATGHNPAQVELKFTKDHTWQGFEAYFEDGNYTHPTINLTPLGQSLYE